MSENRLNRGSFEPILKAIEEPFISIKSFPTFSYEILRSVYLCGEGGYAFKFQENVEH